LEEESEKEGDDEEENTTKEADMHTSWPSHGPVEIGITIRDMIDRHSMPVFLGFLDSWIALSTGFVIRMDELRLAAC